MEPRGKGKVEYAARNQIRNAVQARDWDAVREVFEHYGHHLLLLGMTEPVGEVRVYVQKVDFVH